MNFRFSSFAALSTLLIVSAAAQAQFAKRLHIGNISAGGTGQFSTVISKNATPEPSGFAGVTIYPRDQFTTTSAGFVASMQLHPVTWAGIQINYGFTHYQERFLTAYAAPQVPTTNLARVSTDMHEATAGYLIHPKHIPLQPYVVIGGGATDFNPRGRAFANSITTGTHQWRGTGYLETGIDIPTGNKHIGFRVAGRTLIYRAPNFGTSAISTRSWRSTEEPSVSAVYKF